MWFTIIAAHKGGLAHYKVVPDKIAGAYKAYLERYDGKQRNTPPQLIILVRGMKAWSASVEDQVLVSGIGTVIDKRTGQTPPERGTNDQLQRKQP
jgi:hypothetical protein